MDNGAEVEVSLHPVPQAGPGLMQRISPGPLQLLQVSCDIGGWGGSGEGERTSHSATLGST